MNLHTALTRAAALAFAEDHQQLVGCIVGSWEIAHPEDVSRSNQMDAPIFTVFSWGPDLTAMMTALDEAGVESDQDWANEATTWTFPDCEWVRISGCDLTVGSEE